MYIGPPDYQVHTNYSMGILKTRHRGAVTNDNGTTCHTLGPSLLPRKYRINIWYIMVYVCHIVYGICIYFRHVLFTDCIMHHQYNELVVVAELDKKPKSKTKPYNAISKLRRLS